MTQRRFALICRMTRRVRTGIARLICLVMALSFALPALASTPLTIGIFAYRPKAILEKQWRPLEAYLAKALGDRDVHIQILDQPEIEAALGRNALDFIFTNPTHFITLREQSALSGALATQVSLENNIPVASLGGVFIRRAERNDIATLADFKGKTIAASGRQYLGGFVAQAAELVDAGIPLNELRFIFTGQPHDKVIDAVLAGKADVGFIRTGIMEQRNHEGGFDAKKVAVIAPQTLPGYPFVISTRLYPEWPFIALPHVDPQVARRVASALLAIEPSHPLAKSAGIHGFTIPADYSVVERAMRDLRLPPYDSVPAISLGDVWSRYRLATIGVGVAVMAIVLLALGLAISNRRLVAARREVAANTAELAREKQQLLTLVSTLPDLIWLKDANGIYLDCNPRFEAFLGASKADIVGKTGHDFLAGDMADSFREHDRQAMALNVPSTDEEWITFGSDGHRELLEVTRSPMYDSQGALIGVLGIGHDITRRRHNELALAASEEKHRSYVTNAPEAIFVADEIGQFIDVNPAACDLVGYSRDELLAMSIADLAPPDDVPAHLALFVEVKQNDGAARELPLRRKDGANIIVNLKSIVLPDNQVIGFAEDITARKAAEAELESYRHHLEEVVSERAHDLIEANAALATAKEAAEAANRAKSAFVANMSHELRTPLNAILGFAQLMARDSRIPEESRANLHTINRSGQHLLSLINDILEISKIEAGRLTVQPATIDLHGLLHTLTESMSLRVRDKGLQLRLDLADSLPRHIDCDIAKLRQILLNLLSNAVKFTRVGEVVLTARAVRTAASGNRRVMLDFAVTDSGVGIAPNELERIFTAFYQADAGIRQGEGTGLGLTISREYARLLGGELSAESTPGKGSTFHLSIPSDLAEMPEAPSPQGHVRGLSPGQPAYRVLIAEDEPINQDLLRMLLEEVGFSVKLADNGLEAVELFQQWQPHFIWMDMRMPKMNGFEATRAIRALPGGASIPIVAFTASAFDEDRVAIMAAGCNDVMTKPLEESRLFELMVRYLKVSFEHDTPADAAAAPVNFDLLPAAMRQGLILAAEHLDTQAIRNMANELKDAFPDISSRLLELADSYRFDLIAEALNPS